MEPTAGLEPATYGLPGRACGATPPSDRVNAPKADHHFRAEGTSHALQEIQLGQDSRSLEARNARLLRVDALRELLLRQARLLSHRSQFLGEAVLVELLVQPCGKR